MSDAKPTDAPLPYGYRLLFWSFRAMASLRIKPFDMPFTVFAVEADRDYLLARLISFLLGGFESRAGFFAQQACEKYMKAITVDRNKTYADTHQLLELAKLCEPFDLYFSLDSTKRDLESLDLFDQVGRYGAAAKYDPMSKGKPITGAQFHPSEELEIAGAWIWTPQQLNALDGFVFKARSLLDFGKTRYDDGLKSILEDNQRSELVVTWRGPSLKKVLTTNNNYFKV